MKKIIIALVIVLMIIILLVTLFLNSQTKKQVSNISPTPQANVLPTDIVINNPDVVEPTLAAKLQQEQSKADYDYAQKQEQRYETYPWFDQLPLHTDDYFMYFDTDEKKFIGRIYKKENEIALKEEIIAKLRELGIEVEKYEIVWQ